MARQALGSQSRDAVHPSSMHGLHRAGQSLESQTGNAGAYSSMVVHPRPSEVLGYQFRELVPFLPLPTFQRLAMVWVVGCASPLPSSMTGLPREYQPMKGMPTFPQLYSPGPDSYSEAVFPF